MKKEPSLYIHIDKWFIIPKRTFRFGTIVNPNGDISWLCFTLKLNKNLF